MGVHSYIDAEYQPVEYVCCAKGTLIANTLAAMAEFGQSNKPLWVTEGSCGKYCPDTNGHDEVAWTGKYYTLLLSEGEVARFDWYCYDIYGTLWDGKELTPTGKAVAVMQWDWGYAGGTFSGCQASKQSSCKGAGNIWTCGLKEGGSGTAAQVAWYDSEGNTCSYTPSGSGWVDYNNLYDQKTPYSGGPVTLTNSPILFEK
jgi:hypothetical protein